MLAFGVIITIERFLLAEISASLLSLLLSITLYTAACAGAATGLLPEEQ